MSCVGSGNELNSLKNLHKGLDMKDRLSGIEAFELLGSIWQCWVADGGARYEWRSTCGRMIASRDSEDFRRWSMVVDGVKNTKQFDSLKKAMIAALGIAGTKKPAG